MHGLRAPIGGESAAKPTRCKAGASCASGRIWSRKAVASGIVERVRSRWSRFRVGGKPRIRRSHRLGRSRELGVILPKVFGVERAPRRSRPRSTRSRMTEQGSVAEGARPRSVRRSLWAIFVCSKAPEARINSSPPRFNSATTPKSRVRYGSWQTGKGRKPVCLVRPEISGSKSFWIVST